jgi:hypothetical protein
VTDPPSPGDVDRLGSGGAPGGADNLGGAGNLGGASNLGSGGTPGDADKQGRDKPGGVDKPEHPDSGSATLPLRGASHREAGFPRAQAGDGSGGATAGEARAEAVGESRVDVRDGAGVGAIGGARGDGTGGAQADLAGGAPAGPGPEPLVERGRGRRRLALVVPVVAVVCGLVAGGVAGERVVTRRAATGAGAGVGAGSAEGGAGGGGVVEGPAGVVGPVEQLRGAGRVLFTDPQGRAHAQGADGGGHRVLGQLGELTARRAPSGFDLEAAAHLLSDPPDGRSAELGHDADQVYLLTSDGAAALGKLGDGSLRRLVPAGWRSPGAPRHAADGSVLGVCGYKLGGDPSPAVTAARSWVLDGSGQRLATLPGCLYDVAPDGGSALVADPAEGRRAGPMPGREFLRRPPVGGSDQLTRGLRLWRRDGSFRPVLGFDDVVRVFRTVQPGVDPRGLVVVTAVLGPDGRRALVRIVDALADVDPRTGREVEVLAVVDLARGGAEPAPEHLPGLFAFLPTGGWALTGGAGTATYLPPDRPPQLLRSGIAGDGVYAIEPSPDGAWLLLAGATWRFIRADDPSVQVSYPAPGRLASWVPEPGR